MSYAGIGWPLAKLIPTCIYKALCGRTDPRWLVAWGFIVDAELPAIPAAVGLTDHFCVGSFRKAACKTS